MKVFVGGILFLQLYDATFLYEVIDIPQNVLKEFQENQKNLRSQNQNGGGGNDFVFVFKTEEAIRWLMNQDYILDYNEISIQTDDEINDTFSAIIKKHDELVGEYHGESETLTQIRSLEHLVDSYELYRSFKAGKVSFDIPDSETAKKYKPKPGFFSRIFQ